MGSPRLPATQRISPDRVRSLIGIDYPIETIEGVLSRIGCTVERDGADLLVTPPSWRPDLIEAPDFAEEVARIDGYDKIPVKLPQAPAGRGLTAAQRSRRQVSRALAYGGYVETPSMGFQDESVLDQLRIPADDPRRRRVLLANPLSAEMDSLRTTLLPGLLATVVRNRGRGFDDVAVYELGTIFREPAGHRPAAPEIDRAILPTAEQFAALAAALPVERLHAAVAIAGDSEPKTWATPARSAAWHDAIAAVRQIASSAGADIEIVAGDRAPWHPGRCAEVRLTSGEIAGYAGELHPAVCDALGLPSRTAAAEVDLQLLIDSAGHELTAPEVSPFPPATQDLAIVVDADVPASAIERVVRHGSRTAAGVGGPVRPVHRGSGRRGQEVPRVRPHVPSAGPYPRRRRRHRLPRAHHRRAWYRAERRHPLGRIGLGARQRRYIPPSRPW